MTEEEARDWVASLPNFSRETMARVDQFAATLREENERQNLVARASLDQVWTRHIADSAQLLVLRPHPPQATWIDLGTGAGFPGLIVALLHPGPVTLVEERRKRADFLARSAGALGVAEKTQIVQRNAERMQPQPFDVISARAFAPLDRLFELGERFSTDKTRWILPKGRNVQSELEAARASWQGEFHLEPSLTDADARIIVATGVRRKPAP